MKVKFVQLSEPVRIIGKNGYTENTHIDSSRFDIELINFSHFEVRNIGEASILAIVPFSRAKFIYPADGVEKGFTPIEDSDFAEVDELPETLDPFGAQFGIKSKKGSPKTKAE